LRVVLDSELRTPETAKIVDGSAPTLIFTRVSHAAGPTLTANGARVERLASGHAPACRSEERGIELRGMEVRGTELRGIELRAMLGRLADLQMNEVFVEAGPTLSGAFVQQGLADELLLYVAPKLLGPQARALFDLPPLDDLQRALHFRIMESTLIGEDLRLRLRKA
jgi:diaminohydroxyphosphoribosylaminopyrimidine deaminase/5-amino-6-(5-phosphoribosylamino)uracil reductase